MTFKNVLHVPNVKRLISVGQLTRPDTGAEVTFKGNSVVMKVSGRRFTFGTRQGKLYEMNYCFFAAVQEKVEKQKGKTWKGESNGRNEVRTPGTRCTQTEHIKHKVNIESEEAVGVGSFEVGKETAESEWECWK